VAGDWDPPVTPTLVKLLDADAVLRADAAAVAIDGPEVARGAEAVAAFAMRARGARPALVDGAPAAAWMPAVRRVSRCCSRSPPTRSRRSRPSQNSSAWRRSISSSRATPGPDRAQNLQ
jgi:hypothetical protein